MKSPRLVGEGASELIFAAEGTPDKSPMSKCGGLEEG